MPVTDARIARLRAFGLSEYAARAYLALLDLGAAEARAISSLSRVPTSKIYHVLDHLHARGLAEILPEYPKRYAPIAIEEFLERARLEHEEAARAIARDRDALAEEFSVSGDVRLLLRGGLVLLRGREVAHTRLAELVDGAQERVLVLASARLGTRLGPARGALARALARGVAVDVVLPPGGLVGDFAGAAIRRAATADPEGSALVVVDAARALLLAAVPEDDSPTRGRDVASVTDNPVFAGFLASLARSRYELAEPEKETPGALRA